MSIFDVEIVILKHLKMSQRDELSKNMKTALDPNVWVKLLHAESPFRWNPEILSENLNEIDVEIQEHNTFSFQNFVVNIVKCYREYQQNNLPEALKIIDQLEDNLYYLKTNNCSDLLFNKIGDALDHIVSVCKALLLVYNNDIEDVPKLLNGIISVDDMNNSNKAAIYAIRSNAESLYSFDHTVSAIGYINIAMNLDPEVPYWQFLKGTYLYKIRNLQNLGQAPLSEERVLFENAYQKEENNPLFMVYLADIYREIAIYSSKRKLDYFWFLPDNESKTDLAERIAKKCQQSLELYRKSYKLKPACPIISFRCAYGLMTLHPKFQDTKMAKEIISVNHRNLCNSGFGNFVSAKYYNEFAKDLALTKFHLEACVKLNVFKGYMNMIVFQFREQQSNFDALDYLKNMLKKFQESPKRDIILSQMISYYIFVDFNLETACEFMLQYFKTGAQANCLQVHQSCFIKTDAPISLIDVITDEVKIHLSDRNITPKMHEFFKEFVNRMNFQNIKILKGKPQHLRQLILENKKLPRNNMTECDNNQNLPRRQPANKFVQNKMLKKKPPVAHNEPQKAQLSKHANKFAQYKMLKQSNVPKSRAPIESGKNIVPEKPPVAHNEPQKVQLSKTENKTQSMSATDKLDDFFKKWKLHAENDGSTCKSNVPDKTESIKVCPDKKLDDNQKREKNEKNHDFNSFKESKGERSPRKQNNCKRPSSPKFKKYVSESEDDFSENCVPDKTLSRNKHHDKYESKRKEKDRRHGFSDKFEGEYSRKSERSSDRGRKISKSKRYESFSESSSEFSEPDSKYLNSSIRRNRSLERDIKLRSRDKRNYKSSRKHRNSSPSSESSEDRQRSFHRRRSPSRERKEYKYAEKSERPIRFRKDTEIVKKDRKKA